MSTRMNDTSPYDGIDPKDWEDKTKELLEKYPVSKDEIIQVTLKAWNDIFASSFGSKPFKIGVDIFPSPQIMAFLLHELIPLELQSRYPKSWRRDTSGNEKDLVHLPNDNFSTEIKASSSATGIFGNRSYAQPGPNAKKAKSGYLLAVNFEKFSSDKTKPEIRLIRLGWLDHTDWIGQSAQTGQQARLNRDVRAKKMTTLYDLRNRE